MKQLNRRSFLGAAAAGAAVAASSARVGVAEPRRKRIALIATEVRKMSHAQHFADRFLEGYGWAGAHHHPEVDLVSLYVDQFPEGDLARDRERRHKVKIYPTIAEALTLGGSKLAVDGVVIIGEHGKYPRNERGQTLYPRYEFFQQTVKVFESSGRAVPVFNDKHLSTDWAKCVEMVETSRRLGFPFLAGSSLPVTWRMPEYEPALGAPLAASVCVCYGGVDSYDFHGIETAQCMSERRRGGESGVTSAEALRGAAVWERLKSDDQMRRLFLAALNRSESRRAPEGYTFAPASMGEAQRLAKDPVGYFYEHADGLRTAVFLMSGYVTDFTYAGERRGTGAIESCLVFLPMPPAIATTANFFNPLIRKIEEMIVNNRAPYPIERTLLTSGMTLFAVESLFKRQAKLATPELSIAYKPSKQSHFWRA